MEIGEIAPEFSLIGADNMIHTLAEFRGYRATVITFVSEEEPLEEFKDLHNKFHSRGVAFIAIHSTRGTLKRNPFSTYLQDPSGEIAKRYDVELTLQCFLFDQKRHLIYVGNLEQLNEALEEYLDSRPISNPRTLLVATV